MKPGARPTRAVEKTGLHPRNRHRGLYDFEELTRASPALAPFVRPHEHGGVSIDFSNPAAVKELNRALLQAYYGVSDWDIPAGYLCPPIPGRADYLHHVADLLAEDAGGVVPRGPEIALLDIGVGANCIYPLIGSHEYGWRFVGSEVDPIALANAQRIVAAHPSLTRLIECRRQRSAATLFGGIVRPGERFAASLCNPPFHASGEEARAGTRRKVRNLGGDARAEPVLNFGGQAGELWCPGGEQGFLRRMIAESAAFSGACRWFTALVSKAGSLPVLSHALARAGAADMRVIPMSQGQKQSRILAWRF